MINALTGTVQSTKKQMVMLFVHGISFELAVPDEHVFDIGSTREIHTYMHWNTEQGPSLFGFVQEVDRTIFRLVISCPGVGPRLGLAVLAELGAHGFINAIEVSDEKALSSVNGIGLKKAEQMIVQLKHKVRQLIEDGFVIPLHAHAEWQTVSEALKALHYSRPEIQRALEYVRAQEDMHSQPFDRIMRVALAYLSKQS